jgi:hypothetical protein
MLIGRVPDFAEPSGRDRCRSCGFTRRLPALVRNRLVKGVWLLIGGHSTVCPLRTGRRPPASICLLLPLLRREF